MVSSKELVQLEHQAPVGAFSRWDMEIFIPYVRAIPRNGVYLEIGVDKGRSLWLARQVAPKTAKVYGVDLKPDPKIPGTKFTQGHSVEVSKKYKGNPIDVLFIDGDHSYEGCKADMEAWMPLLRKPGVVLFHDCDETSPGVVWALAEYADKHHGIKRYEMLKRTDRNTSMAVLEL